ncbi:MAG: transcription antitermination factor NusB [Acholeplasmataceae bacterium]|nr:transcription antitermination factor NusB [Acholeplasmataceae bacterium]
MTRRDVRVATIIKLFQKDYDLDIEIEVTGEEGKLFLEILSKLDSIDNMIEKSLENYSLNRLSYLDRAIIRFATYEMLYTDTPKQIIIDEAIEITKEYSDIDDKQRRFNNKLLDNIKKQIGD